MTDARLHWDRWAEADRILAAAVDLPAADRAAFVRAEVPEPGEFRDLILRLVARLDDDEARVSSPSGDLVRAAFGEARDADSADLTAGTAVGPYRVVERLARGGMATVYAADRADGAYRQRVALKVLRRGLDTDDLVRRFRAERQILSSLAHPHIAKLLDGGSLPDGRPWLAMELVSGARITDHADARELGVTARLGLFLGVADAVQAAHRQLVVHRDIKPSNILVDGEGRVRLLDFGIARLLDGEAEHTGAGARALTPAYASPEQLAGGTITTATDVFQLGMLLRELLTGVGPSGGGGPARDTTIRPSRLVHLDAGAGVPPAERARRRGSTVDRLSRALRGDLDRIVTKATREDPEDRYHSAGDLAADVRRFLRGEAVMAHPGSLAYRARKFTLRHRWAVLAASAALVVLAGYVATLVAQNNRVARERDRAEREARTAAEVTEFMVDLFHAADPDRAGGSGVTVRDLLGEGARRLREEQVGEPGVRGAMLSAIGRSYAQLGLYAEAEQELSHAVEAHRSAPARDPAAEARTLSQLAQVVRPSDPERALAIFDDALAVAERSLGPSDPLVAGILVESSLALAAVDPRDARVEERRARAVALLRAAPGDVRGDLANALTVWARGKPAAVAIPLMREALDLRRALHPERHSAVAASLSDLGLATDPVDPQAADSLLQKAVDILHAIPGRNEALLLTIMNNLAALRRDRGEFARAEPLYREVLALRRSLYPDQPLAQAYTLYGLGVVLVETGRAPEGEARLREALDILAAEVPRSPLLAITRSAIGHARAQQGDFPAAEALLVPAWETMVAAGVGPAEQTRTLGRIVALYRGWGRRGEARAWQTRLDSLEGSAAASPR